MEKIKFQSEDGTSGRENRKEHLDQLAAIFILQGYLDSLRNG